MRQSLHPAPLTTVSYVPSFWLVSQVYIVSTNSLSPTKKNPFDVGNRSYVVGYSHLIVIYLQLTPYRITRAIHIVWVLFVRFNILSTLVLVLFVLRKLIFPTFVPCFLVKQSYKSVREVLFRVNPLAQARFQDISMQFYSHSLRYGGTTALAPNDASMDFIQCAGQWFSDAFCCYVKGNVILCLLKRLNQPIG